MNDDLIHKAAAIAALFFVSCLIVSTIHGWTAIAAGILGLIGIYVVVRVFSGLL